MKITSFVSQYFFKGHQQIGETEMLSLEFWEKNVPYTMLCFLLPYLFIFWFRKKSLVFEFLYKMQINLKHHAKSEID